MVERFTVFLTDCIYILTKSHQPVKRTVTVFPDLSIPISNCAFPQCPLLIICCSYDAIFNAAIFCVWHAIFQSGIILFKEIPICFWHMRFNRMCFLAFKYRDKLGSNVTKHAPALTHIISLFMLQFSFLHLYYLVQLTSLAFIWGRLQFMFSRAFHHRCYITLKYVILLINALKEI